MDDSALLLLAVVAVTVGVVIAGYLLFRARTPETPRETSPRGLIRTSTVLGAALRRAWGSGIDDSTWLEIEEALLAADVGVSVTKSVVDMVRSSRPDSADAARVELGIRLRGELDARGRELRMKGSPSIVLVVGVNGSGKTTTIAKLASRLKNEGRAVVLGAADTFRAAAGEQLEAWGSRLGVDVIRGQEGGDPASVAFDAIASARAKGADVVIVDTAGRLHGKKNLMAELAKIHRVAAGDGQVDEVLLVLDATSGQNGLEQVREFADTIPISGIVLTKLDGTARGGIVIAVERELGVPIKFIGVGEGMDDLIPFDPDVFVHELLEAS